MASKPDSLASQVSELLERSAPSQSSDKRLSQEYGFSAASAAWAATIADILEMAVPGCNPVLDQSFVVVTIPGHTDLRLGVNVPRKA